MKGYQLIEARVWVPLGGGVKGGILQISPPSGGARSSDSNPQHLNGQTLPFIGEGSTQGVGGGHRRLVHIPRLRVVSRLVLAERGTPSFTTP